MPGPRAARTGHPASASLATLGRTSRRVSGPNNGDSPRLGLPAAGGIAGHPARGRNVAAWVRFSGDLTAREPVPWAPRPRIAGRLTSTLASDWTTMIRDAAEGVPTAGRVRSTCPSCCRAREPSGARASQAAGSRGQAGRVNGLLGGRPAKPQGWPYSAPRRPGTRKAGAARPAHSA